MTGTDVALYRLTSTYATLSSRYGVTALTIASSRPSDGASIAIPSSYWKRIGNCKIDGFVPQLREGEWTWRDSIRYDTACDTIHGTSGSPIVDAATNQIVGINNTGNDDGERCTLNNPCEVAADGTTKAFQGQSYGEQTYWFTTCLTTSRTIDLNRSGCLLTRPWPGLRRRRTRCPRGRASPRGRVGRRSGGRGPRSRRPRAARRPWFG